MEREAIRYRRPDILRHVQRMSQDTARRLRWKVARVGRVVEVADSLRSWSMVRVNIWKSVLISIREDYENIKVNNLHKFVEG